MIDVRKEFDHARTVWTGSYARLLPMLEEVERLAHSVYCAHGSPYGVSIEAEYRWHSERFYEYLCRAKSA